MRALSGTLATMAVAVLPLLGGCGNDNPVAVVGADTTAPFPPNGVFSITGDGVVSVFWNANQDQRDLAGYAVYRSSTDVGPYNHLSDVSASTTQYDDFNVTNGQTWYYAVTAFDRADNESKLSKELVFDTPRPAGTGLTLFDFVGQNNSLGGYDFSSVSGAAQAWNAATTDIYFGVANGVNTLFVAAGVDIQDFGWVGLDPGTTALDLVDWAPDQGWAPSGAVEVIPGHAYVVRIIDGPGDAHYAKLLVRSVTNPNVSADARKVTVDWAYQVASNNQELAPGARGGASK